MEVQANKKLTILFSEILLFDRNRCLLERNTLHMKLMNMGFNDELRFCYELMKMSSIQFIPIHFSEPWKTWAQLPNVEKCMLPFYLLVIHKFEFVRFKIENRKQFHRN